MRSAVITDARPSNRPRLAAGGQTGQYTSGSTTARTRPTPGPGDREHHPPGREWSGRCSVSDRNRCPARPGRSRRSAGRPASGPGGRTSTPPPDSRVSRPAAAGPAPGVRSVPAGPVNFDPSAAGRPSGVVLLRGIRLDAGDPGLAQEMTDAASVRNPDRRLPDIQVPDTPPGQCRLGASTSPGWCPVGSSTSPPAPVSVPA